MSRFVVFPAKKIRLSQQESIDTLNHVQLPLTRRFRMEQRLKKIYDSPFGNLDPVWGVLSRILYIVVVCYFFLLPVMRMIDDVRLNVTGTVAKESDCLIASYQGTRTSSWHIVVSYVA